MSLCRSYLLALDLLNMRSYIPQLYQAESKRQERYTSVGWYSTSKSWIQKCMMSTSTGIKRTFDPIRSTHFFKFLRKSNITSRILLRSYWKLYRYWSSLFSIVYWYQYQYQMPSLFERSVLRSSGFYQNVNINLFYKHIYIFINIFANRLFVMYKLKT